MCRPATCAVTRSAPAPLNSLPSSRTNGSRWREIAITGKGSALSRRHRIYDHIKRSTRTLAFIAGKSDIASPYGVTIPLLKDVQRQVPQAICEITATNISRDLIINRAVPPFDNPDLRRAMALSLDRKAFIDILTEGQGDVGGAMLSPPEGIWGMPLDMLARLPGYDPDVPKNRAEARRIMERLGYGPDKRLPVKLSTRNMAAVRDPAVLLIDQLKEIYIDGELETIDTVQWYPKLMRKDYTVASGSAPAGSTTPTSNSMRITFATPRATTMAIAILNSTRWSIANQSRQIRTSAGHWSGQSKESWRRTSRGRSSSTRVPQAAGSLMSKG